MNTTHLRLPELAIATLVSLAVLTAAVTPALLVAAPRTDRATLVQGAAAAGIEYEALPVPYRA
jgi:hypothetical protein